MLPPLSHIPDTSVWHYRLQLNIYAYIVQKYYGHSVSGMTIVCCHPDNEGEPWLDAVPWMVDDVEIRRDALGGSSSSSANGAWASVLRHQCLVAPFFTLQRFSHLFWLLPLPLDTKQSRPDFDIKLKAGCKFFSSVARGQPCHAGERHRAFYIQCCLIPWLLAPCSLVCDFQYAKM